jgi:hypothetical protein
MYIDSLRLQDFSRDKILQLVIATFSSANFLHSMSRGQKSAQKVRFGRRLRRLSNANSPINLLPCTVRAAHANRDVGVTPYCQVSGTMLKS